VGVGKVKKNSEEEKEIEHMKFHKETKYLRGREREIYLNINSEGARD
jgi:hypothetical protein